MRTMSPAAHRTADRFTARMFRGLWVPAMLSSLGWALSDMADAVVVGQRLGAVGLAAIGLILPVYMINCMFAHGLGLGGSVRYSRLLSQGKTQEAADSFHGVLALALLFSVTTAVLGSVFIDPLLALLGTRSTDGALYAATRDYLQVLVAATPLFYLSNVFNYYLRNDGSQRRAGAGSVIGNLCDIALNITLVLALDMGTRGAALSTALGQIITIAIYLPGFFGQKHTLRFALPRGRWFVPALSALKAGMATSVQYLYQMIFFLVCNNLLIRLGGETAVAHGGPGLAVITDELGHQGAVFGQQGQAGVLLHDAHALFVVALAPGSEADVMQAAGDAQAVEPAAVQTVGGALIALVELWPAGMCLLFGIAGSTSEALACTALRLYGAGALFAGINILLCNYYQACENEKPSFLLETLRGAVLLIPLTFVCYALGLQRFWLLFLLTEAGSLAVFLLLGLGGRYKKAELPEERIFQRTILSNAEDVMDVCRELEAFCEIWGADMKQQMFSTMTVEELGMAILKHGFQGRTDGYLQLTAIMDESGVLELHLRDDATTFNPFTLDTSRASWDEDFDMDGMGVLVIKKRAKEFFYRRYQGFNTLIIKI